MSDDHNHLPAQPGDEAADHGDQIGRASCRERV